MLYFSFINSKEFKARKTNVTFMNEVAKVKDLLLKRAEKRAEKRAKKAARLEAKETAAKVNHQAKELANNASYRVDIKALVKAVKEEINLNPYNYQDLTNYFGGIKSISIANVLKYGDMYFFIGNGKDSVQVTLFNKEYHLRQIRTTKDVVKSLRDKIRLLKVAESHCTEFEVSKPYLVLNREIQSAF